MSLKTKEEAEVLRDLESTSVENGGGGTFSPVPGSSVLTGQRRGRLNVSQPNPNYVH